MAIECYGWPGNIRELKNALERAAILCTRDQVTVEDLPDRVLEHTHVAPAYPGASDAWSDAIGYQFGGAREAAYSACACDCDDFGGGGEHSRY